MTQNGHVSHRRRKVRNIGGGGGGEYWGAKGGQIRSSHFDVMCPLGFNKSVPDKYISYLKV